MNLKFKILKKLVENKSKKFTIKKLSELLQVDYKNTYDTIQKIKKSINIDKRSNASYISFKPVFTIDMFIVETQRRDKITEKIPLLYKDIQSIDNPFFIPILFGSFAKGTETKSSDIDICILHDNEDEVKKIFRKLSVNPNVEFHVFRYDEFIQMLKTKDFNVGHEIREHGLALTNIETYYKLISHG